MKKIIFTVSILFLVGSGCISNTTKPTKEVVNPAPVVEPIVATEEKTLVVEPIQEEVLTYKNKLYGFQFSYPSIANIEQSPFDRDREGLAKISLKFPDSSEVTFNVFNRDNGYIYDYYSDQKNQPSEADRGTEPLHLVGMWTKNGVTTKRYILSFVPYDSKLNTIYVVELKQIGNYLIRATFNSTTTTSTVTNFLETNPLVKIIDTMAPLSASDIFNFDGKSSNAILDGLAIDAHSQLVWNKNVILTREDLGHNLLNSNLEELTKADIGFTEITKFLRNDNIYFYFGAGAGCEGCFRPLPKYIILDPQTGTITYQELDKAKNPHLFERMDTVVVSPDKLKGAYTSNGSGSQNKPNEPEVVWVIDFTTGVSKIYKKLPLGQTVFEMGYPEGELKWDENSEKLIIKTIKREE